MNCEICEMKFDHSDHKPFCIIPCTHTYCIYCLNRLIRKKCPKCDAVIKSKNPNWSLINLIPDYINVKHNEIMEHKLSEYTNKCGITLTLSEEASQQFNKGLEKFYQKEYIASVEAYDKAIRLDSSNVLAYNNKGISLKELKDFSGAVQAFNKAIELEPRFEKAYNNLGRVYFDVKNYTKAIECFEKAIEINPNYVLAYHNRGLAFHSLKNYIAAINSLTKAIKLDETSYESYIAKGLAIKQLRNEFDLSSYVK